MSLDYSKLPYDPFVKGRIKDKYPTFNRRRLFRAVPQGVPKFSLDDFDKMIRFVILFLDPLSPFFEERDDKERTKAVLEALDYNDGERFLEEVTNNSNLWQLVLLEYFKMIHHAQFEAWFSLKMSLHIMNAQLRSPDILKASERRAFQKDIRLLTEELLDMEQAFFPDDRTMRMIAERATEDLSGYAEKHALSVNLDDIYTLG